jgi:hypothetical protein
MHLFRSAALAAVLALTAAVVVSPAAAQAQIAIGISVNFAPPPLPVYEQPPIPEADAMWIPGYWAWDDAFYDYYWVPGTWAAAPEPGLLWTPAYWGWNEGAYAFHGGYWGAHVGYYGGVAYGFGYNGAGYEGGEWRSGHFFYNRTVNNVTNIHITNVYEKTVIVNRGSNASFNGPGGATAKPTPEQLAVAQERHVQPTPVQTEHARAAAAMPALHASANHGAPPVAATGKPAEFSGAGVVRASGPGGDYHPPAAVAARQAQAQAAHGVARAPAAHPEAAAAATGPEQPKVAGAGEGPKPADHAAPLAEKPAQASASVEANEGGPKPRTADQQGQPAAARAGEAPAGPKPAMVTPKTPRPPAAQHVDAPKPAPKAPAEPPKNDEKQQNQ